MKFKDLINNKVVVDDMIYNYIQMMNDVSGANNRRESQENSIKTLLDALDIAIVKNGLNVTIRKTRKK